MRVHKRKGERVQCGEERSREGRQRAGDTTGRHRARMMRGGDGSGGGGEGAERRRRETYRSVREGQFESSVRTEDATVTGKLGRR